MRLVSWGQERDITLMIRLRLAKHNLQMDSATLSDLKDFIAMKQKFERRE